MTLEFPADELQGLHHRQRAGWPGLQRDRSNAKATTSPISCDVLEQAAKADISPEATENLIPALLANLKVPPQIEDQYAQRLRHGLAQYYARHYRATEVPNE